MKGWLLIVSALVSHVLLIATVIYWGRSYFVHDQIAIHLGRPTHWRISSEDGVLWIDRLVGYDVADEWEFPTFRFFADDHFGQSDLPDRWTMYREYSDIDVKFEFAKFGYATLEDRPRFQYSVSAPFWFLTLLFGILPLWWFLRFRRNQRSLLRGAAGLCASCGYDLKPTAADACPECGAKRYARQ